MQPKILEVDLTIRALRELELAGGTLSTRAGELQQRLRDFFNPADVNAAPSTGGGTEFDQIVRNIVSNRANSSPDNMIERGFATYDDGAGTVTITEEGHRLLRTIGYDPV